MKSIIAMFVAFAVATVASADIAINLVNNAGYSATDDGSGQYVVQLVQNDLGTAATVDESNLLNAGDTLLTSYTSAAGFAELLVLKVLVHMLHQDQVTSIIRIFDLGAGNGDVGSAWEIGNASAGFIEYDSLNPGTIYSTDGIVSSPFTLGASGTAVNVIPEPATIGLLGIAGAGLYAARRKTVA